MGKIKDQEKLSTKERMKRYRKKKTEEERAQCREKDKLRKSEKLIEMTEEEQATHRKKDKERKARKRKEIKEKAQKEKERKDKEWEAKFYRDQTRDRRSKITDVKREYERIEQLLRNRKARAERNGKEHLLDNLKAKREMQIFKEEGRIKKFERRFYYKRTELEIWRKYREIGPDYKEWLEKKNPDISKIFDEVDAKLKKEKEVEDQKKREEEERRKKEREEQKKMEEEEQKKMYEEGYWGVQHGDWYWYGKGSPPPAEIIPSWECTEEEEKRMEEEKLKAYELYFKELAEEREKEKQKKKEEDIIKRRECQKRYYRKKKKALQDQVVEMPELGEKSAYQLLQEKNIEELEQRKKASGLFDDDN